MDTTVKKKEVHEGDNLVIARKWKKMTQSELADLIGMHQTVISALEQQKVIDPPVLKKIADAMEIPLSFFTDFDIGAATNSYVNTNNITAAENSSEVANGNINTIDTQHNGDDIEEQQNITEQKIYNPLDDVKELYERLLQNSKEKYDDLKERYDQAVKEIEQLKARP